MKLPEISGKFTTPKPWQIGVGVALVAFVVVVGPAITHVMVGEPKKKPTTQITAVGKVGEPWHPPLFPAAISSPPPRPPTPPPRIPQPVVGRPPTPPTQPSLAAAAPIGKPAEDPEQAAINAPIIIAAAPGGTAAVAASVPGQAPAVKGGTLKDEPGGMTEMLKPTETSGFKAERMPHQSMTVPQGTLIQCHSVTRMTSGLNGFVNATVSRDVWSADDTAVLIERDSKIFGEITHGVIGGVNRMFVLWRQLTTPRPNLVRITLNSPVADEMGEAGLTGDLDTHFWQKIKGALLLSGIESVFSGVSGALSNLGNHGGNNQEQGLNLNLGGSFGSQGQSLASEMLRSQIQIPDTLTVDQSAPCSIFVAGDLDFTDVYQIMRKK